MSGRWMVLRVSAQLLPGAVVAIHLRTACSALAKGGPDCRDPESIVKTLGEAGWKEGKEGVG